MARKFGRIYKLSKNFEDYSYIINGIGGIGKTTMVYEIGKLITGSNEGTFIITCGVENKPKHIDDAFGDVAPDFKTFTDIVKELCENKAEYPDTKFVAIDSMDEFARITENYVVAEWNKTCDINDRAKSIAQAYKGFQKGESRACDLMLTQIMKLQNAGYSLLLVGHTKTKLKEDVITKIQFEQLTCNLDNKYYNALKDKVNLVAMCYTENVVDNVEEKKNAFTKKMDKIGQLTDRKRVMVFADTENAVDCKSHFPYIVAKVDFGAANFIQAVRDALDEQSKHPNGTSESKPVAKEKGEKVIAGSLNFDGFIKYKAERIGKESTVSEIVKLVIEASNTKAPIAQIADKISGIFVPSVIVIAIVTFLAYLILGYDLGTALNTFITVLVVACPCSLGLATPLAIVVSEGVCAENGILVKKSEILENA